MFPAEPVPEQIGAYQVLKHVGFVGSADVYTARMDGPMGFSRDVTLKLVNAGLDEGVRFAEDLAREAQICARLNHPVIVRMYDFFEYDRRLVLVLEQVEGASLDRLLAHIRRRKQKISDAGIFYLACQLGIALAHAHASVDEEGNLSPVIHRDLKPENVFISWDGNVRLAGFGLGKILGRTPDSIAGTIRGTPGYMAPEQARGERATVRSDVYGFGVLLWSLLSGKEPPLDGARLEPIAKLRPDLPREIIAAIDAALEPSPDRRRITCAEFTQWLTKLTKPEAGREELRQKALWLRATRGPASKLDTSQKQTRVAPRRRLSGQMSRPSTRRPAPMSSRPPPASQRPSRGPGSLRVPPLSERAAAPTSERPAEGREGSQRPPASQRGSQRSPSERVVGLPPHEPTRPSHNFGRTLSERAPSAKATGQAPLQANGVAPSERPVSPSTAPRPARGGLRAPGTNGHTNGANTNDTSNASTNGTNGANGTHARGSNGGVKSTLPTVRPGADYEESILLQLPPPPPLPSGSNGANGSKSQKDAAHPSVRPNAAVHVRTVSTPPPRHPGAPRAAVPVEDVYAAKAREVLPVNPPAAWEDSVPVIDDLTDEPLPPMRPPSSMARAHKVNGANGHANGLHPSGALYSSAHAPHSGSSPRVDDDPILRLGRAPAHDTIRPQKGVPVTFSVTMQVMLAIFTAALVITVGLLVRDRMTDSAPAPPQVVTVREREILTEPRNDARATWSAVTAETAKPAPSLASSSAAVVTSSAPSASPSAEPSASASAAPVAPGDLDMSKVSSTMGYLTVNGPENADVYINGVRRGPTREPLLLACGHYFMRLAPKDSTGYFKPWITPGQSVMIACNTASTVDSKAGPTTGRTLAKPMPRRVVAKP